MGPDHYVPLIAMAKARKWSLTKTGFITLICGIAHVLSAALIAIIAILIGFTLTKLNFIESWRGNFAAWLLIIFGLIYILWGMCTNNKNTHKHNLSQDITLWILVLVFVLGPCEPLIPLLLYPAIAGSIWNVILVTILFSIAGAIICGSGLVIKIFGL